MARSGFAPGSERLYLSKRTAVLLCREGRVFPLDSLNVELSERSVVE